MGKPVNDRFIKDLEVDASTRNVNYSLSAERDSC